MSELLIRTTSVNATELFSGEIKLKDMQDAVGGLIQVLHLQNAIMIVNEEGFILELPLNVIASQIFSFPIFGDAILLTNKSMEKLQ